MILYHRDHRGAQSSAFTLAAKRRRNRKSFFLCLQLACDAQRDSFCAFCAFSRLIFPSAPPSRATIPEWGRRLSIPGNPVRPAADARTGWNLTPFARRSISTGGIPNSDFSFLTRADISNHRSDAVKTTRHRRTPPGMFLSGGQGSTRAATSLCEHCSSGLAKERQCDFYVIEQSTAGQASSRTRRPERDGKGNCPIIIPSVWIPLIL
jgi:hypothetical protein